MDNKSFEIVTEVIRSLAREKHLPKKLFDKELLPSTSIEELGMDSLGHLNLISELEEKIDKIFPDSESGLNGIKTLGDLADKVSRLIDSK